MENEPVKKGNVIVAKSFDFALSIVQYSESLEELRKFVVANQFLKSGTSVGANVWEAQHAESRADFVHKLKIAAKEANETDYWLLLSKHSQQYPTIEDRLEKLLEL
nr:four helix bundle protein [Rufibacter aurantiacus]